MLELIVYFAIPLTLLIVTIYACYLENRNYFLQKENCMLKRMVEEQTELHRLGMDAYTAMLQTARRHNSSR